MSFRYHSKCNAKNGDEGQRPKEKFKPSGLQEKARTYLVFIIRMFLGKSSDQF